MLKRLNETIFLTIIFNCCILAGAQHSIGPFALFQIFSITELGNYMFVLIGEYHEKLMACVFIGLIGQLALIISRFINKMQVKIYVICFGLLLLLLSFFLLTIPLQSSGAAFSFATGIPFLITSFILLVRILTYKKHKAA